MFTFIKLTKVASVHREMPECANFLGPKHTNPDDSQLKNAFLHYTKIAVTLVNEQKIAANFAALSRKGRAIFQT